MSSFEKLAFPILPDGRARAARALRQLVARRYEARLAGLEALVETLEPGLLSRLGLSHLLSSFRTLPRRERERTLLLPAVSRWLFTMGNRAPARGPFAAPERRLLGVLAHALAPAVAAAGRLDAAPFSLYADAAGDVRFPGSAFKIRLGPAASGKRLRCRREEGSLRVEGRSAAAMTPLARFRQGAGPLFNGQDPMLEETLRRTTLENRLYTRRRLGAASIVPPSARRAAREGLEALRRCWPQEHTEILAYTTQIIPIDPRRHLDGTLTHLQGGIFFAPKPARWRNVEFLIHEAAHLKMNLLTELHPVLEGPDRYHRSPWSGVPRLSSVLLQAGYVYLLVSRGLELLLAHESSRRGEIEARLRHLAKGFAPFFGRISGKLPLTPEGRAFLEAYRSEASKIQARWGRD